MSFLTNLRRKPTSKALYQHSEASGKQDQGVVWPRFARAKLFFRFFNRQIGLGTQVNDETETSFVDQVTKS